MRQRKLRDDDELVAFPLRLKPMTVDEIKRRAEGERRKPSQFLRNLIEDSLKAGKVMIK